MSNLHAVSNCDGTLWLREINKSGKPAFCGALLFDRQTVAPGPSGKRVIQYQYVGAAPSGTELYPLTSADIDSGVANVEN